MNKFLYEAAEFLKTKKSDVLKSRFAAKTYFVELSWRYHKKHRKDPNYNKDIPATMKFIKILMDEFCEA